MKILVCVPMYRSVTPATTQGLVMLAGAIDALALKRLKRSNVETLAWMFCDGWSLIRAQNEAAAKALREGMDALVFVEQDISFHPVHFARLVEAWLSRPHAPMSAVGAAYPASWAMGRVVGSMSSEWGRSDDPADVVAAVNAGAVMSAKVLGMGFTLIPWKLLDAMKKHREKTNPADPRLFHEENAPDGSTVTSDVVFCRHALAAGGELFLDFGCQVSHHVLVAASLADVVKGWGESTLEESADVPVEEPAPRFSGTTENPESAS